MVDAARYYASWSDVGVESISSESGSAGVCGNSATEVDSVIGVWSYYTVVSCVGYLCASSMYSPVWSGEGVSSKSPLSLADGVYTWLEVATDTVVDDVAVYAVGVTSGDGW